MRRLLAAAVLAVGVAAPAAHAGRSCDAHNPTAATIEGGLQLAQRTLTALESSGAQVVVLARAGQDLGKYGLRWSHLGFAYRQDDGAWRVLHKLNQCGSAEGSLYRQGLGEFFLDDLWRQEAAWAVPAPDVQHRLLALLKDPRRAALMHQRPYSMVSYAWGRKYQQSNQWAIETLAAAMEPAAQSRAQAQGWLQRKGYQPSTLRLGPLTRLGARAGGGNVAFDDHPDEKRFSGRIETVTVDSVFAWLQQSGLAGAPVVLRAP